MIRRPRRLVARVLVALVVAAMFGAALADALVG